MSLAGLIAVQRAEYGVPYAVSCRALGVSQAWFYKWRNGDRSPPPDSPRSAPQMWITESWMLSTWNAAI